MSTSYKEEAATASHPNINNNTNNTNIHSDSITNKKQTQSQKQKEQKNPKSNKSLDRHFTRHAPQQKSASSPDLASLATNHTTHATVTNSSFESMRRRKEHGSGGPGNNRGSGGMQSIHEIGSGFAHRRGSTGTDMNTGASGSGSKPSITYDYEPTTDMGFTNAPTIAEFMPADAHYKKFLSGSRKIYSAGEHTQTPVHLQLANFCTIFSLIAMFHLLLFGTIIEVQPLYIKGISSARTPMVRNLKTGEYTAYSFVHFSKRLKMLQTMALGIDSGSGSKDGNDHDDDMLEELERHSIRDQSHLPTYYFDDDKPKKKGNEDGTGNGDKVRVKAMGSIGNNGNGKGSTSDNSDGNINESNGNSDGDESNERLLKNMNMAFEMKSEAKVAFKAAALYFVTMVFSYIYVQNHVLIWQKYRRIFNGYGHGHGHGYSSKGGDWNYNHGGFGSSSSSSTSSSSSSSSSFMGRLLCLLAMCGKYIHKVFNHYRRRQYRNVHEVNNGGGSKHQNQSGARGRAGRSIDVLMNKNRRGGHGHGQTDRHGSGVGTPGRGSGRGNDNRHPSHSHLHPNPNSHAPATQRNAVTMAMMDGMDEEGDDLGLSLREWEIRKNIHHREDDMRSVGSDGGINGADDRGSSGVILSWTSSKSKKR